MLQARLHFTDYTQNHSRKGVRLWRISSERHFDSDRLQDQESRKSVFDRARHEDDDQDDRRSLNRGFRLRSLWRIKSPSDRTASIPPS